MNSERIELDNSRILRLMSEFLNFRADAVTLDKLKLFEADFSLTAEPAYAVLLAAELGLDVDGDADRRLFEEYVKPMIRQLDADEYRSDIFYSSVKIPPISHGNWQFCIREYKPCEAFVYDDPHLFPDGKLLPRIGFFTQTFAFPAVLQAGREWMTITPNEVNTMRAPIAAARGKVLAYGLGLGYFAFCAAAKDSVENVTVVECDERVIKLFNQYILPQFSHPEKLKVVCADAFEYAEHNAPAERFDVIFTDIWHDPSDGVELYLKMKGYEKLSPESEFWYWIEKTLKLYI